MKSTDAPASSREAGNQSPKRPRRSRVRMLLFALLPVALVAGGYEYVTGGQVMSTENAYVQGDMVGIATDVSGIVKQIAVRENQAVKAGDVLFRLDDLPFRLAVDRAEAQIGIVRNDLAALQASYRDMQAQIAQAQADIDFYTTDLERQKQLANSNFASRATYDQSRHNVETARQKQASLTQQLAAIAANLNGHPDGRIEDHPRYRDAVAARDEVARQLSHTVVRAPADGVVTKVPSLQVGQYLPAATAAFSLVATDHVWVEASPKETELTYVRPGQPATVTVDSYPGAEWTGTVDSISPASGASFSLLPAQNSSGNWVKVVQRIPMRVRIDTPAGKPPLRVGMSVVVDVDTGHARGLPDFVTSLFGGSKAQAHGMQAHEQAHE
ncbi:HlyD family secretion protein [Azospirillum picis]|uniref:Membrane fusion protein (Multidrug efflux system) n=1 Tax=Azospirillum picis TaxID=488438 RepID=A0ABU0MML3_9PROT|nr:HlyD family secretion protein [Azospirillum picis]MBP2300736.1 membrane fusion protein (multidrug efflux system) [Azospirillum picis]MDQ0534705.1 membrane fusion protein (multidrug efflux system) [Azospirillum picis]